MGDGVRGDPAGHSKGRGWSDYSGAEEAEQVAMAVKTATSSWEICLAPAAASFAQLGKFALWT